MPSGEKYMYPKNTSSTVRETREMPESERLTNSIKEKLGVLENELRPITRDIPMPESNEKVPERTPSALLFSLKEIDQKLDFIIARIAL